MNTIWFDMDGTIADLYGVKNWLDYLLENDTYPYEVATPLINMSVLARLLNKLQKKGYKIGIVSWTSKNATDSYAKAIEKAKRKWLKKHLKSVNFDEIAIIPYGTPKSIGRTGILFDDEKRNRDEWKEKAYNEKRIIEILREL